MARDPIDEAMETTPQESDDLKDRKSYMQKVEEMLLDMRMCELQAMIIGVHEVKTWYEGQRWFILHGNPGCELWYR